MSATEDIGRRQCIPIIYTRGTHYEVGFDVGRTFASLIQNFLKSYKFLHESFLPAYNTSTGRKIYEETLKNLQTNFPQYVAELQGTADGAAVPFHELFLLHIDNVILNSDHKESTNLNTGCSTVCLNYPGQEILGHTEDASSETLNHFYLVSAHIKSEKPQGRWNVTEEKFTSLCYAGHLPGYTMNYNHHGLVFSTNTICAKTLIPGRTPRHFLTRALLSAENFFQAEKILKDEGCGTADGLSLNMTFLNQDSTKVFYNVEIAPDHSAKETQMNILRANSGEHFVHCNTYLRLSVEQIPIENLRSTNERFATLRKYPKPSREEEVVEMLGDYSNEEYPVFRDSALAKTIAVGLFNCTKKTWTLYSDNPRKNKPLLVLPIVLKNV